MYARLLSYMVLIINAGCSIPQDKELCQISVKSKNVESYNITDAAGRNPKIQKFTDERTSYVGFKEENGKVIIPAQYTAAYDFNIYGVADVLKGEWYKINTSGQPLVKSYLFENGPDYYVSGLSRFEENGKLGFVNVKGEVVVPAQFDWATPFFFSAPISIACIGCKLEKAHEKDEYPLFKGGKWGVVNHKGDRVVPFEFTDYTVDEDGTVILLKDNTAYKVCLNNLGEFQAIKK